MKHSISPLLHIEEAKRPKSTYFNSLQVYRGIASLMVVFHHLWTQAEFFLQVNNSILNAIGAVGKLGVDFFFVLSGYIITTSNYSKANKTSYLANYYIKRIFRIFIPYLPIGILIYIAYLVLPDASAANNQREISWVTSFFLIPHGEPALGVAWTLVFEMFFYTVFCFWFVSKGIFQIVLIAWAIFIISQIGAGGEAYDSNPIIELASSPYNLEFLLGLIGGLMVKRVKNLNKKYLLLGSALIMVFALIVFFNYQPKLYGLIFALSFFFLVIGSVNSKLDNVSENSIWMKFGNASYSIYLVHGTIISILLRISIKASLVSLPYLVIIAIYIISVVVGMFYSKIFEVNIMKKAMKLLSETSISEKKWKNT